MRADELHKINRDGWDRRVEEQDIWTCPVYPEEIQEARAGNWSVVLTPNKAVPKDWFGELKGKDVLCLASGGGQQGPILAAAGANVVVFDASAGQLAQDEAVSRRDGLSLTIRQGFMHDLSAFADGRFDLIFHPVSNCYAPEITPVWRECYRVLRAGGVLLAGFMNPIVYVFDAEAEDADQLAVKFALPYADVVDRSPDELRRFIARDHTVEFSHTLEEQIGGQMEAGFVLTHMFEDKDRDPRSRRSRYFPTCMATRALKLEMR
ncbi:MAG: class I SAM-dependent methyltransferase [Proteobacteria bacterium]|nr:class I SAM-dependent methyltransferase [Pseudomonadota bacterium]